MTTLIAAIRSLLTYVAVSLYVLLIGPPFLLIALLASGTVPLGGGGDQDLVDPASEPVVADLDRDTHQPDVLVSSVESHRHLAYEAL